jgi:hypothetical protein
LVIVELLLGIHIFVIVGSTAKKILLLFNKAFLSSRTQSLTSIRKEELQMKALLLTAA